MPCTFKVMIVSNVPGVSTSNPMRSWKFLTCTFVPAGIWKDWVTNCWTLFLECPPGLRQAAISITRVAPFGKLPRAPGIIFDMFWISDHPKTKYIMIWDSENTRAAFRNGIGFEISCSPSNRLEVVRGANPKSSRADVTVLCLGQNTSHSTLLEHVSDRPMEVKEKKQLNC